MSSDGGVDRTASGVGTASNQGQIVALNFPPPDLICQPQIGVLGQTDNDGTRGVSVETVNQSPPAFLSNSPDVPKTRQKTVGQAAAMTWPRGVGQDSGRLVDDGEVLIFIHHGEVDVFWLQRWDWASLNYQFQPSSKTLGHRDLAAI